MSANSFSPTTVAALRLADRRLRSADRGDHHYRYAVCRNTLSTISHVDSFYIAFYRGDHEMVFPYLFEGNEFQSPDVGTFGPRGLSHWIRVSRRTYRPQQDHGALLGHGLPFGDVEKVTADSIVCPLFDPVGGEVVGLMSVGSSVPDIYTDEVTAAAEWLGRALMHSAARDDQDAGSLDLYTLYPELDSSRVRGEADLFLQVATRIEEVQAAVRDLAVQCRAKGQRDLAEAAEDTTDLCERLQVEIADLFRRDPPQEQVDPLDVLTERETEVARLIAAEHPSNAELAQRLHISEKTVKTHVSNILRKLGVTQRSAIGFVMQPSGHAGSLFDRTI